MGHRPEYWLLLALVGSVTMLRVVATAVYFQFNGNCGNSFRDNQCVILVQENNLNCTVSVVTSVCLNVSDFSTEASFSSGGSCVFDKLTVNGKEYCTAGIFSDPSGQHVLAGARITWVTGNSFLGTTNISVCPRNDTACFSSSTPRPTTASTSGGSCSSLGVINRRDCLIRCSQSTCSDASYTSDVFFSSRECICSGCITESVDASFAECADKRDWTYFVVVGAVLFFCCLIFLFQHMHNKHQNRVVPLDFEGTDANHDALPQRHVLADTPAHETMVPPLYELHQLRFPQQTIQEQDESYQQGNQVQDQDTIAANGSMHALTSAPLTHGRGSSGARPRGCEANTSGDLIRPTTPPPSYAAAVRSG
eukprot:m.312390 g.312390  ORF g.312390 m.312390 type:complete len:365 (+) comp20239_c0_seq5:436-1530(+)